MAKELKKQIGTFTVRFMIKVPGHNTELVIGFDREGQPTKLVLTPDPAESLTAYAFPMVAVAAINAALGIGASLDDALNHVNLSADNIEKELVEPAELRYAVEAMRLISRVLRETFLEEQGQMVMRDRVRAALEAEPPSCQT